jgi:hypothetical protein
VKLKARNSADGLLSPFQRAFSILGVRGNHGITVVFWLPILPLTIFALSTGCRKEASIPAAKSSSDYAQSNALGSPEPPLVQEMQRAMTNLPLSAEDVHDLWQFSMTPFQGSSQSWTLESLRSTNGETYALVKADLKELASIVSAQRMAPLWQLASVNTFMIGRVPVAKVFFIDGPRSSRVFYFWKASNGHWELLGSLDTRF